MGTIEPLPPPAAYAVVGTTSGPDQLSRERAISAILKACTDHPEMTVKIGKGPRVAPSVSLGLGDDVPAGLACALDRRVDFIVGGGGKDEHALAATGRRRLAGIGDPFEADRGHQHDPRAVVEGNLQRLGDPVLGQLAHNVEAHAVTVEGVGRLAIADGEAMMKGSSGT